MLAALDSCAGLIRLVAELRFGDRDAELAELVGSCLKKNSGMKPQYEPVAKLKVSIDAGQGVGGPTILSVIQSRRRRAPDADAEPANTKGLHAIREAVATLKASGEHDRIIADVAAVAAKIIRRRAGRATPIEVQ